MPLVTIFPEGCTTNGQCIINFKKGAFAALKPVRPVIFKYKQHFRNDIQWTQDVVGFVKHQLLGASYGMLSVELDCLPVFKPNDYFWEHHQKKGEEKWETFARAIREIMANHSGQKLCDLNMDDKLEYKKQLTELTKEGKQKDA